MVVYNNIIDHEMLLAVISWPTGAFHVHFHHKHGYRAKQYQKLEINSVSNS